MTINEIKELARYAAQGKAPETFSVSNVDEALRDALTGLAGSINQFMKNRYDIYEIIVEAVDSEVPNRVIDRLGIFADVRVVPNGTSVVFKRPIGKSRAKRFITQVGFAGYYETFRLDNESFTIEPKAIGGACTLDFERMLDGSENMNEYVNVLVEGMEESVYMQVQRALIAAFSDGRAPSANRKTVSAFNGDAMFALTSTVRAYGNGAVIFAAPEFIAAMGPDAIVPVPTSGNYGGVYHPQDIDAIHNEGYINIFRGTPIVMFPQSYADEMNSAVMINPQYAYVLPTGGDRVVKVVLEGQTQIWDRQNRDLSMEIDTYRKVGVGVVSYNNWGIYQNTALSTIPVYEG